MGRGWRGDGHRLKGWICQGGVEMRAGLDVRIALNDPGLGPRIAVYDPPDARMGAAAPWLWAEAGAPKLQAWHRRMVEEFPIRFVGKGKECKVWGLKG